MTYFSVCLFVCLIFYWCIWLFCIEQYLKKFNLAPVFSEVRVVFQRLCVSFETKVFWSVLPKWITSVYVDSMTRSRQSIYFKSDDGIGIVMWLNVIYAELRAKRFWSVASPVAGMRSLWEFAGGHVVLQLCCWGQLFLTCAVPVSIELGDSTPCTPSLSVIKTVPGGCAFHAPSTQSWIHIFSWLRALRLTILVSREENRLFWSPIIGSLKPGFHLSSGILLFPDRPRVCGATLRATATRTAKNQ